jgi:O-methyltransferase involved in polyketide biosynthesis
MPGPLSLPRGSAAISPTAHYTGHVWNRNDLSHPALATLEGRVFFEALRPVMRLTSALGSPRLESFLLARHRAIDRLLERAIDDDDITQVIEVACGMSPRGWRFSERYGSRLTYLEADLPGMASRKRRALERIGSNSSTHRVVELDALSDRGRGSLGEAVATLDPERGLVIITEGLLSYFAIGEVLELWRRFADALAGFRTGLYLSDLHVSADNPSGPQVPVFLALLSTFVRGPVRVHFRDESDTVAALTGAGFAEASALPASRHTATPDAGGDRVRIIRATP